MRASHAALVCMSHTSNRPYQSASNRIRLNAHSLHAGCHAGHHPAGLCPPTPSVQTRSSSPNVTRGVFMVRTAEQLLQGYDDPLMAALASVLPTGMVPSSRISLLPGATPRSEALRKPPSIVNTGAGDISQLWNVSSDLGMRACGCKRELFAPLAQLSV